ncbi:hypothetical protein ACRJ4B_11640 [Streptomyces sp. GTA36]
MEGSTFKRRYWSTFQPSPTHQLARRLAQRMDVPEPLVVIGPSGAGKSSLLGAGLLSGSGAG